MTKSLVVFYLATMLMLKWEMSLMQIYTLPMHKSLFVMSHFNMEQLIQSFALFSIWSFNCFCVIASFYTKFKGNWIKFVD